MRHAPPLSVLLVAAMASPSAAAPVARLALDVDEDGVVDAVTLDAGGQLTIATRAGTGTVSTGITDSATLAGSLVRGVPTVVVRAAGEVTVVQGAGSSWRLVLRTRVGGVGPDEEYATEIAAIPDGLFRFQTRAGAFRCDGKPALLFGERYEAGRFQRLARLPTFVPDSAPVIAARLDPGPAPAPLLYQARVASHQVGVADAGGLAIPSELDDGQPATVWREELVASAGEGQFFTFTPRIAGAKAAQLRVVPGAYPGSNRPRRLAIVSASAAWHVDLPDAARDAANSAYVVDLPTPVDGCLTVVIESTYGPTAGTTALGELVVLGDGERSGGGEAVLARAVAEGADGASAAAQALARRGARGVAALDAELARATQRGARGRLLRAAIASRDPGAPPLLARAVQQRLVDGADLVEAIDALAGGGQGAVLAEVAARRDLPLEPRIAAVRALDAASDPDRELLTTLAGVGPRALRQAIIERLARAPLDALVPIAQAQAKPAAAGDVWRAIARRAVALPAERAAATAALAQAIRTVTDYERRYRLADGIALIGDAQALARLAELLRGLPDAAETSGIKHAVALSLGVLPRPEATALLIELLRDRDPGVRLTALSSIASAAPPGAGPWHADAGPDGIDRAIMTALSTDRWPEVRRAAAQTLGSRCGRPGPAAALVDAVARDPEVEVRGDALAGLVECRASGSAALLAGLWDDARAPLLLRQRAVDLTASLGDPSLTSRLIDRLATWRGAALESETALALAQSAAYALGRLPSSAAAAALMAALDDAAFPEIVAASAAALGLLGPACPLAARERLSALASSSEQQIQIAARRAAAQCGKR